jgi:hypothetical protein
MNTGDYAGLLLSVFLITIGSLTSIFSYLAIKNNNKKSMKKLVQIWIRHSFRMTEEQMTTYGIKLVLFFGILLVAGGILFFMIWIRTMKYMG